MEKQGAKSKRMTCQYFPYTEKNPLTSPDWGTSPLLGTRTTFWGLRRNHVNPSQNVQRSVLRGGFKVMWSHQKRSKNKSEQNNLYNTSQKASKQWLDVLGQCMYLRISLRYSSWLIISLPFNKNHFSRKKSKPLFQLTSYHISRKATPKVLNTKSNRSQCPNLSEHAELVPSRRRGWDHQIARQL